MRRPLFLPLMMVSLAGCGLAGNAGGGAASEAPPPPPAQPFCTRSLGTVECWASTADQPQPARPGVADGPARTVAAPERAWGGFGFCLPASDDPAGH
jgi:hypothetical protein